MIESEASNLFQRFQKFSRQVYHFLFSFSLLFSQVASNSNEEFANINRPTEEELKPMKLSFIGFARHLFLKNFQLFKIHVLRIQPRAILSTIVCVMIATSLSCRVQRHRQHLPRTPSHLLSDAPKVNTAFLDVEMFLLNVSL